MFGFTARKTRKAQVEATRARNAWCAANPVSQEEFSKGLRVDTAGMTMAEVREANAQARWS